MTDVILPFNLKNGQQIKTTFNGDKYSSGRLRLKTNDKHFREKVLLLNPKKPYVKARDGELKPIERVRKMPEDLKGMMTQEEYSTLVDTTFESCVEIHRHLNEQILAPKRALEAFGAEDKEKMLPYLPERDKFKLLANMTVSDMSDMERELNSIRKLYSKYLNADNTVKKEVDQEDAFFLELITDIKLRYVVCANRIRNTLLSEVQHISDFYTTMVINYYHQHPEEAPEDIKKFISEELYKYTNPNLNAANPAPVKEGN